jgi:transcriptional antiterminator RfaH
MTEINHPAWYVVHTKPKQEARALENLQNQGYVCFLPMMQVQKLRRQKVQWVTEPMFSRYLFIQLDDQTQNWGPIRSTLGVSKLVSFGPQPTKVPAELVELLQQAPQETIERMFAPGDTVQVADGPFKGLEGKYLADQGEMRAFVLIDLLGQPQKLSLSLNGIRLVA